MTTSSKTNKKTLAEENPELTMELFNYKTNKELDEFIFKISAIVRDNFSDVDSVMKKARKITNSFYTQAKEAGRKEERLEILNEIEGRMPYRTKRHYKIIEIEND